MIDKHTWAAGLLRTKRYTALMGILAMTCGLCFTVMKLSDLKPPEAIVTEEVIHRCEHPSCAIPHKRLKWNTSLPIGFGTGLLCGLYLVSGSVLIGMANRVE